MSALTVHTAQPVPPAGELGRFRLGLSWLRPAYYFHRGVDSDLASAGIQLGRSGATPLPALRSCLPETQVGAFVSSSETRLARRRLPPLLKTKEPVSLLLILISFCATFFFLVLYLGARLKV